MCIIVCLCRHISQFYIFLFVKTLCGNLFLFLQLCYFHSSRDSCHIRSFVGIHMYIVKICEFCSVFRYRTLCLWIIDNYKINFRILFCFTFYCFFIDGAVCNNNLTSLSDKILYRTFAAIIRTDTLFPDDILLRKTDIFCCRPDSVNMCQCIGFCLISV